MFHHINISDPHIVPHGDPYTFYQDELVEILDYLLDNPVDLVTIAGDLFDTIYKADSLEITVAMKFIHQLIKICASKDAYVRLIKGTEGHDYDQLNLFENYTTEEWCDVKIIESPCNESIKDLNFKFLPEMFTNNYEIFKENHLNTSCDIMVFHGMIRGALEIAENNKDKIPIMEIEDIERCINLYCVGGHIHTRTFIENNIWYTGSFSSKNYNDANETKGFDHIIINESLNDYEINYIENKEGFKFETINLTEDFLTTSRDTIRAKLMYMNRDKKSKSNIRIDVDTSNLNPKQLNNLDFIKVKFRTLFDFKTFKKELNTNQEVMDEKIEKAKYILDKNIRLEDKILMEMESNKRKYNLQDDDIDKNKIINLLEISRDKNV